MHNVSITCSKIANIGHTDYLWTWHVPRNSIIPPMFCCQRWYTGWVWFFSDKL